MWRTGADIVAAAAGMLGACAVPLATVFAITSRDTASLIHEYALSRDRWSALLLVSCRDHASMMDRLNLIACYTLRVFLATFTRVAVVRLMMISSDVVMAFLLERSPVFIMLWQTCYCC